MHLIDFMNNNVNWETKLAQSPYSIDIKWDGDYCILKYNMIESNMKLLEVQEARGSIFRKNDAGKWICVCRAMDKFGNWGESYAATNKIDWSLGVDIQEKVDGSIIRLWYDNYYWHVSSNGTIDAFCTECGDTTFGDIFKSLVQEHNSWNSFLSTLDIHYTYWFELVSPYNPVVVHYNEFGIYYLGARNIYSMKEDNNKIKSEMYMLHSSWMKFPKHYHYNSLDECLEAAHNMGEDEEGYVICAYNQMENDSFLRIKVKGDEYLKRHKLRGNGPLTTAKIISLWQEDSLDDFLAYFPENAPLVDVVIKKLRNLWEKADIAYDVVKKFGNRREFALRAQSYVKPIQSYLFARLDNKVNCAQAYFKQMKAKNLTMLLDIKDINFK